ncbi:sensor histidine kinase [Lactobacillus corticis]|uniref:Histidine kinase n=1 Tax=Lactobacillus corticis TaxID=2201249 RepID=A0A916QFK4_9LACO|nr:GHKL domain-containing protein [Lactobacillus corticis]GFZ26390.1 histidine kinase [Lactobacillus corticis]
MGELAELMINVVLLIAVSVTCDFLVFYWLSGNQFEKRDLLLSWYYVAEVVAIALWGAWGTMFGYLLQFTAFVYWFRRRQKYIINIRAVAISIICGLALDMIYEAVDSSLPAFTNQTSGNLAMIACELLLLTAVYHWRRQLANLVQQDQSSLLVLLEGYTIITLLSLNTVILTDSNRHLITASLTAAALLQVLFGCGVFYAAYRINQAKLNQQEQAHLKAQMKDLEDYANYLEQNEDDLRRFKHDYLNLLESLNLQDQTAVAKLTEYTAKHFDQQTLSRYQDLNHVHIKPLKNLLLTKFASMHENGLDYSFECDRIVDQLGQIEVLDLVRVLGIALDNAIEASRETPNPQIKIMLYQDQGNLEFEVRNKTLANSTIGISELGATTKDGHSGIGLANVKQLVEKYPQLSVDYNLANGWFDFYLVIEGGHDA